MSSYRLDAPLDELLDMAKASFQVEFTPVGIDTVTLEVLQIADMETYVDELAATAKPGQLELPFWAKIWPASLLLGYYVNRMQAPAGASFLEIGAGIGHVGLVAAQRGFDVTITDIDDKALLFSQINILHNGLQDKAVVRKADFSSTRFDAPFDFILGSEVLYIEDLYRPLVKFLLRALKAEPHAEVVLAKEYSRKAKKFFNEADKEFHIQEKVLGYKEKDATEGDAEKYLCAICRLRHKKLRPA